MANRRPVVMLHGIGADSRLWQPQLDAFVARGYAPVPHDFPGYGPRPAVERMDFEMLARDAELAIEEAGLERPVLLGHSMGGMVVQTMLRRKPDAYAAAILCATSPAFGNPSGDFQKAFVQARIGPLDAGRSLAEAAPEALRQITGPRGVPEEWRGLALQALAATKEATFRAAVHNLITFDERANLEAIRIPVLCLAGEVDTNAPARMMERMASRIPGAEYACLNGIGHAPNIEDAPRFNTLVLDFLDRHLHGKQG